MVPGETILSGAPDTCPECGSKLVFEILQSAAGYYIGTMCECGPYSRESGYYPTLEAVQADFFTFKPRENNCKGGD